MPVIFISRHSAHAFPWDEIAKNWWGDAAGEGLRSASASYEQGAVIGYNGQVYWLYRVLYESPDTALILTASEIDGEIRYDLEFLCIAMTDNSIRLVNATSSVWFTADEKSLLDSDEEFVALSTREILNRIERHPLYALDYRHPVDCIKWAKNYIHDSEILPYLKNYKPDINYPVADRTPFPRSGF